MDKKVQGWKANSLANNVVKLEGKEGDFFVNTLEMGCTQVERYDNTGCVRKRNHSGFTIERECLEL